MQLVLQCPLQHNLIVLLIGLRLFIVLLTTVSVILDLYVMPTRIYLRNGLLSLLGNSIFTLHTALLLRCIRQCVQPK